MQINIEFHGILRQLAGGSSTQIELGDFALVADALNALSAAYPQLVERLDTVACAMGDALVSKNTALEEDSTLVLLPPVSGG